MKKKKKKLLQASINDYLDLAHKAWFMEFEVCDFGASITNLLELPLSIFEMNAKAHFWAFIKLFLQKCEIGFIFEHPKKELPGTDIINLALIGLWQGEQFAIPLWILKDLLIGFEVITPDTFTVLDSEPLSWVLPNLVNRESIQFRNNNVGVVLFGKDIFQGQKIFFRLDKRQISICEYFNELEFFTRIAQTEIPELDG